MAHGKAAPCSPSHVPATWLRKHRTQPRRGLGWRIGEAPPEPLHAAIIYAVDGALVPAALKVLRKDGRLFCVGMHMSENRSFPYASLGQERETVWLVNLTRRDGLDFLKRAPEIGIVT